MAFADPPFNLRKKYKKHKDRMEMDDYLRWCEDWLREMVRDPGIAALLTGDVKGFYERNDIPLLTSA